MREEVPLSPFPLPADVQAGRTPTRAGPMRSNQLGSEVSASLATAQRQVHLWKREVDTQKRVIVELRDKIAELQRFKMNHEQVDLKVRLRVPARRC